LAKENIGEESLLWEMGKNHQQEDVATAGRRLANQHYLMLEDEFWKSAAEQRFRADRTEKATTKTTTSEPAVRDKAIPASRQETQKPREFRGYWRVLSSADGHIKVVKVPPRGVELNDVTADSISTYEHGQEGGIPKNITSGDVLIEVTPDAGVLIKLFRDLPEAERGLFVEQMLFCKGDMLAHT
jgi:hypothetical protein